MSKTDPLSRKLSHHRRLTIAILPVLLVGLASVGGWTQAGAKVTAAPKHGGSINYNLGVVLDCADAAKSFEAASLSISNAMTDTLVTQDARGNFIPDLATRWHFSHGGKSLTFFLRHGKKFSDGNPVTARAIKANLLRPEDAGVIGPVSAVKVNGKYKFTIEFASPFRPALSNLAFLVPIYDPKTITKNDCQSNPPSGTGVFKFSKIGPGFSTILMKRNNNHNWGLAYSHNKGRGYLNSITFKPVNDPATAVSELLSGDLDISSVAGTQISRVRHNKHIKLYQQLQQSITWLGFNTKHKPFNNPKVRFAIGEAISRPQVIKAALNGFGKPSYSIVPPSVPLSDPAAKSYAPHYNPKAAEKIFKKYHVKGPYNLLCFTGVYAPIAEVVQADLAQAGVQVNINLKSLADYFPVASAGDFDMNVDAYFATNPDFLYADFHSSQETSHGSNYTFYKNRKLDSLIVKGRTSLSHKAAAKAYYAAQRFMDTHGIVDPLYVPIGTVGVSTRVGGFHRNIWALFPDYQDLYIKK